MVDWVEVYKRLLRVYNVKTQAELGMAMGIPGRIAGEDVEETGISWKILDRAVADKDLNWDWLLAGKGETRAIPAPPPPHTEPAAEMPRPRYMETRELARELLDGGEKKTAEGRED